MAGRWVTRQERWRRLPAWSDRTRQGAETSPWKSGAALWGDGAVRARSRNGPGCVGRGEAGKAALELRLCMLGGCRVTAESSLALSLTLPDPAPPALLPQQRQAPAQGGADGAGRPDASCERAHAAAAGQEATAVQRHPGAGPGWVTMCSDTGRGVGWGGVAHAYGLYLLVTVSSRPLVACAEHPCPAHCMRRRSVRACASRTARWRTSAGSSRRRCSASCAAR